MSSQRPVGHSASSTGPNQDANVESSSESKIAFETLFPTMEARSVAGPESSEDSGFCEVDEVIPQGLNYQDFVLFPQSPALSPVISDLDTNRFFADADAVTASDAASSSTANYDPSIFTLQDIAHMPKRNLFLSNNPYDAIDHDTFEAIDAGSYDPAGDDSTSLPLPHYSATTYDDMISSPIDMWAGTYEHHESFAYRFGQYPFDFVGDEEEGKEGNNRQQ